LPPIRTVLWIGSARRFEDCALTDVSSVDLAWTPNLSDALELPLSGFDTVVVDAPDEGGTNATRRLESAGARQVLVTTDPRHYPAADDLSRPPRRREATRPKGLIAESTAIRAALELVDRAQHSSATVLLTGETGTGKEVLARAVHDGSPRSRRAFVAVNCAAFPDTLLESELFGYAKGAFTGADRTKQGLFELADGGTLFLDEIGETSGPLQAKLLRALQEREIRAVGGSRSRKVDVRLIAATNRDLRREIHHGHFREDLYYRLAVFPIDVPPLRERTADILPLVRHFLSRHGEREGKAGCRLTPEAANLLLTHTWPGNVRELENEVQRALALSEPGDRIPPDRLSKRVTGILEPARAVLHEGETLAETLGRVEAWLLRRALDQNEGRRAETARRLGITREGLYKKMKRLGIE